MDTVQMAVTAALGAVGLYLAHNFRRQLMLRLADRRLVAYQALWSLMALASPTRMAGSEESPLTRSERENLYEEFTRRYYENGNGMLMGGGTRNMYLRVKENLICCDDDLQPKSSRAAPGESEDGRWRRRGGLSIRQMSLLRTRMKADFAVYGAHFAGKLEPEDVALLKFVGERRWRRPWGGIGTWFGRHLSDTA